MTMFRKGPNDVTLNTKWAAQAIAFFWKYLESEWAYRNNVVRGSNDQEMAAQIKKASAAIPLEQLPPSSSRVIDIFFSSHPLEQRLKLDIYIYIYIYIYIKKTWR